MGDVPINPSGFAHGFRPLEGADNPPPTPTQRNVTQRDVIVPGGGFLSALSQQTPGDAPAGAMGIGLGSSRKRRRLPGPLALLQQGHSGGTGQQEGGGGSDDDNHRRQSDDSDRDEGEAGGGHFGKGPWLSLCSAVDAPIPEEGASDSRAVQTFLRSAVSPMSEVLSGDFDLRVPVVTAVIDSYTQLSVSDVIVELVDPSGRIKGYLHPGCLEEHGPLFGPGAALLLKEVSIFVSGPGTTRLLNVHPDCILAVFPADTPLPTPSRLEWLTNCEPPFTPRPVSDSGDHGFTPPLPARRTPPTTPAASSAARPSDAASRRRPRPPAVRESPEQDASQGQSRQQRQTTPRISPPAPRPLESLRGERRDRNEELREGRRGQQRHQRQSQEAPATPDVGDPTAQEGEFRSTSPPRTLPSRRRPLPASRSPSPSPGGPSPPGVFSQSQPSQRQHEQIPLGQHSDDDEDGRAQEGRDAAGRTVLSAASAGRETSDRRRGFGDLRANGRVGASSGTESGRWESPGGVDKQDSFSRREDGGRDGGIAATPGSTSAQKVPSLETLVSVNDEDGGSCGEGEKVAGGRGARGAPAPAAIHGDKRNANETALPRRGGGGDAVGPGNARGTALSPGDVADRPVHSRNPAQPAPKGGADQGTPSVADETGRTVGVGGAMQGRGEAPTSTPPSIWADLDGLASGGDSTSDDDQGATRSRPAAPESSDAPSPPQSSALGNPAAVARAAVAAGNLEAGATAMAGETKSDEAGRGEAPQVGFGGASQAAGRAGREVVSSGSAGFSLFGGAGENLGDDELLDAALEDSD